MEEVPSLEACRICANFYVTTSEVEFLNLFEPTQPLVNELVFIEAELRAWQLNISMNDGLPQRICGNCYTKFCSIYAFREEIMDAQQKLLQAFIEGDCAEEIVTAQETIFDDVKPENLEVKNEEIEGLESMLVGNQAEQTVHYMPKAEEPQLYESAVTYNDTDDAPIDAPELSTPINETNEAAERKTNTKPIQPQIDTFVEQDLEEVLQGNYIPKKIKAVSSDESDDDDYCDPSDAYSSCEDDDASNQTESALNPLACQYCYATKEQPIIFSSDDALSQHFFDAHDPTFPYTCPECPLKFNTAKLRLQHFKQRHPRQDQMRQERLCQYCGKQLRGMTREEHIEKCQYLGDWECQECNLKFKNVTHFTFRAHVQREHILQKKQLKCKECGRVFTQRLLFENHLTLHRKNTVLWCNECKEAFADVYELRKHKYKMHNGELPVNCEYCKKGFVTFAFLHRHMQCFHPDKLDESKTAQMSCSNCGMFFGSLHKLRNHQQKPRDENGNCIGVEKRVRSNQQAGVFPCPQCKRRFYLRGELEKHIHSHEAAKRPYKCTQCQVMCRSPAELKQHQDIAHMHIKAFACEQCGRKFAYKKDLRDHMLYHEERNIPCPEPDCGYICKNDKVLNDHIRMKHRLLLCDYCNQTFTRQRLAIHMRTVHKTEIDIDLQNFNTTATKEKVVVQFVGSHDAVLRKELQSAQQYGLANDTKYNPFNDEYAAEMIVEQDKEIDVT